MTLFNMGVVTCTNELTDNYFTGSNSLCCHYSKLINLSNLALAAKHSGGFSS